MTVLYVLLGMAAVVALLLFLRVTVVLEAGDEWRMTLWILFLRFRLFPKRRKPIRLRQFRIRAFRRRRLKEERRYRKKQIAKRFSEAEKERKKEAAPQEPKRSLKENIEEGVWLVRNVILQMVRTFGSRLRIKVIRFRITVAGEDPARTAIVYGCVCQAVSAILALTERGLRVSYPRGDPDAVAVRADFLSGKPVFDVKLNVSFRIWHLLAAAGKGLVSYLKKPRETKKSKSDDPGGSRAEKTKTIRRKNEKQYENAPVPAGREV